MLSSCWWGARKPGTPPLQSWSSGGRSSRFDRCTYSDDLWWHSPAVSVSVPAQPQSLNVSVNLMNLINFGTDGSRLTQRQIDGESQVDSGEWKRSQSSSLEQFVSREIWTELKCVWSCSLYPPLSLPLSLTLSLSSFYISRGSGPGASLPAIQLSNIGECVCLWCLALKEVTYCIKTQ